MNTQYEVRAIAVQIGEVGANGVSDSPRTIVEYDDVGAGEFVVVRQFDKDSDLRARVAFNPGEWLLVKKAVDDFFADARE